MENHDILHVDEVMRRTGKSRTTLWRDVRAGRFPAPVKIGANRIGFLESEVMDWQANLPRMWRPTTGDSGPEAA